MGKGFDMGASPYVSGRSSRLKMTATPQPAYTHLAHIDCPVCHGRVERVRRKFFDRLLSLVSPRRRYRCISPLCQWEAAVRVGRTPKPRPQPRSPHARIEPHT